MDCVNGSLLPKCTKKSSWARKGRKGSKVCGLCEGKFVAKVYLEVKFSRYLCNSIAMLSQYSEYNDDDLEAHCGPANGTVSALTNCEPYKTFRFSQTEDLAANSGLIKT